METNKMLEVNIFDNTCAHSVRDDGYFTSTNGRKPKDICFVHKQPEYNGITLFTDEYILDPVVNEVKSKLKVAWCLESPIVMPHVHNQIHLIEDRFDYIFTYRDDLIRANPQKFIPNNPGGSYIKDEDIGLFSDKKTKAISIVASGKKAFEGHVLRHRIIETFPDIDSYGWGTSKGYLENKADALKDYMYHIVVENVRFPHYFSEKLIDCLVTGCVPLYWGPPNIGDYFNVDGFVLFDSFESLLNMRLTRDGFHSKAEAIAENFQLAQKYLSSDDYLASRLIKLN